MQQYVDLFKRTSSVAQQQRYSQLPLYFDNSLWALESTSGCKPECTWLPTFSSAASKETDQSEYADVAAWPGASLEDKVEMDGEEVNEIGRPEPLNRDSWGD